MKYLAGLIVLFAIFFSCSKNSSKNSDNCVGVTITQTGTPCSQWGIRVNGTTYPSSNIPSQFQQEGLSVCAVYEIYDDMRACACCGGEWANIKSMKTFVR